MLKQWQIVLYVVTATLVVATVNQALAVESSDGWRPKSRSEPKEVLSNQDEEMLQLVPGEISQAATDDGTQEDPYHLIGEDDDRPDSVVNFHDSDHIYGKCNK